MEYTRMENTTSSNNKIRQISNKKYILCIWIGISFLIVTAGLLAMNICGFTWLQYSFWKYLYSIKTSFIFIGLFLIGLGIIQCKNIKDKNTWLSSLPYPLDFEKEIYTHSIIGRKPKHIKFDAIYHPNYISWKKQILLDFDYLLERESEENSSKKTNERNKAEKDNTALKEYRENFFRYLNSEYRFTEIYIDAIKTIMIPLEAGIIGVFCNDKDLFSSLVLNVVVMIMMILETVKTDNDQKFIKDFVEITYNKRSLG